MGSLTSIADIWLGITPVEIDCSARADSCGGRKRLLAWEQCLSEIFGWGPCQFGIFGMVLTSVEGVDAHDQSPGEDMPCGYVGSLCSEVRMSITLQGFVRECFYKFIFTY